MVPGNNEIIVLDDSDDEDRLDVNRMTNSSTLQQPRNRPIERGTPSTTIDLCNSDEEHEQPRIISSTPSNVPMTNPFRSSVVTISHKKGKAENSSPSWLLNEDDDIEEFDDDEDNDDTSTELIVEAPVSFRRTQQLIHSVNGVESMGGITKKNNARSLTPSTKPHHSLPTLSATPMVAGPAKNLSQQSSGTPTSPASACRHQHSVVNEESRTKSSSSSESRPITNNPYVKPKSTSQDAHVSSQLSKRSGISKASAALCSNTCNADPYRRRKALSASNPQTIAINPYAKSKTVVSRETNPYQNSATSCSSNPPINPCAVKPRTSQSSPTTATLSPINQLQNPSSRLNQSNTNPHSRKGRKRSLVNMNSGTTSDDEDLDLEELLTRGPTFAKRSKAKASPKSVRVLKVLPSTAPIADTTPLRVPPFNPSHSRHPFRTYPSVASTSIIETRREPQTGPPRSLLRYPDLLETSKQFPDLRAQYAWSLWRFAKTITLRAHERVRLDQTATKIVKLALSEHPIRSLEEFITMGKTGSITVGASRQQKEEMRRQLEIGKVNRYVTAPTRRGQGFYTITECCLVSLFEHNAALLEHQSQPKTIGDIAKEKDSWLLASDLIRSIDERLLRSGSGTPALLTRRTDPDCGVAHYLAHSTRSAEWLQVTKLECKIDDEGPRIKRHKRDGKVCFELLPAGLKDAQRIRDRSFPSPPGYYRTSRLTCVHADYEGICLGVDRQEGGGQLILHEMCNKLDMQKVPFFVGSLAIGDYVFFTKKQDSRVNYLCPIIIERKSVQDVAQSIYDNRWKTQKKRMYQGQFIFGYNNCKMVYIIEGNEKQQQITGGYVGTRHHNVGEARLREELENLESEGFEVIRTPSRENTMFELCRWSKRIAKDMREGTLTAEFTYQEFKRKLNNIPKHTDFSRLARYHVEQRKESEKCAPVNDMIEIDCCTPSGDSSRDPSTDRFKLQKEVEGRDNFSKYKIGQLKQLCLSVGLPQSGTKANLIARYKGPHPPKIWLLRKQKNQYVPSSFNVAGTALLVALYLHEVATGGVDDGLLKDELYVKAEGLNITKNPFSGGTTQTGPYHYDGWSSMKPLLRGDPALVILKNRRYKLTRSCGLAGFEVAKAMHKWCHEHDNCPCGARFF